MGRSPRDGRRRLSARVLRATASFGSACGTPYIVGERAFCPQPDLQPSLVSKGPEPRPSAVRCRFNRVRRVSILEGSASGRCAWRNIPYRLTLCMTQSQGSPRRVSSSTDNEMLRNSLAMILKLSGHETASVYTAMGCLERASASGRMWCSWISACREWMATRLRKRCASYPGLADIRAGRCHRLRRSDGRLRAREQASMTI